MKTLNTLVDATLAIEKLRVAAEVGLSHLALQGRADPEREELHRRLVELEAYVDGRIARLVEDHPAYPWFSRVRGVGREIIAKVLGLVRVAPEIDDMRLRCSQCGEPVFKAKLKAHECKNAEFSEYELGYADTISALWKFAGRAPEGGWAPRRKAGEKLPYNSQLRAMSWRLGISILKAGLRQKCSVCGDLMGKEQIKKHKCAGASFTTVAISKFAGYYLSQKDGYQQRYENSGVKIVPATTLPKDKNGKRYEPEGVIAEGHVHNQALNKMVKLFLACLWLTWREAEGLPVTKPYAIDKLGHSSFIAPWEMVDREPLEKRNPRVASEP